MKKVLVINRKVAVHVSAAITIGVIVVLHGGTINLLFIVVKGAGALEVGAVPLLGVVVATTGALKAVVVAVLLLDDAPSLRTK